MTSRTNIAGFDRPDTSINYRIIMSLAALEKSGKTHFALTAPGPIALFNFDEGLEGVIHKFADQKEILISNQELPLNPNGTEAARFDYRGAWNTFHTRFRAALTHPQIRTVVVDTCTEVWELLRMARFGKLTQVMPHHYGPVNAEMREVVRECFKYDKNVILLHKLKKEYVGENWNGKYETAGFKDMGFLVQVNCRTHYRQEDGEFVLEVRDCRQNMGLVGTELEGMMSTFPMLASMIFPSSPTSAWE